MWEYFNSSSQFLNWHLWQFLWDFLLCFLHDQIFKGNSGKRVAARALLNWHAAPGHLGDRALLRILSGKVCWGGKAQQREQALRKHATAKLETGNLNPLSFLGQPGQWPRPRHTTTCVGPHTSIPGTRSNRWMSHFSAGWWTCTRAGPHSHKGIPNGVPCCDYSTATKGAVVNKLLIWHDKECLIALWIRKKPTAKT